MTPRQSEVLRLLERGRSTIRSRRSFTSAPRPCATTSVTSRAQRTLPPRSGCRRARIRRDGLVPKFARKELRLRDVFARPSVTGERDRPKLGRRLDGAGERPWCGALARSAAALEAVARPAVMVAGLVVVFAWVLPQFIDYEEVWGRTSSSTRGSSSCSSCAGASPDRGVDVRAFLPGFGLLARKRGVPLLEHGRAATAAAERERRPVRLLPQGATRPTLRRWRLSARSSSRRSAGSSCRSSRCWCCWSPAKRTARSACGPPLARDHHRGVRSRVFLPPPRIGRRAGSERRRSDLSRGSLSSGGANRSTTARSGRARPHAALVVLREGWELGSSASPQPLPHLRDLLASLRFVGVSTAQLSAPDAFAAFAIAFWAGAVIPVTGSGLGVVDAVLMTMLVESSTASDEHSSPPRSSGASSTRCSSCHSAQLPSPAFAARGPRPDRRREGVCDPHAGTRDTRQRGTSLPPPLAWQGRSAPTASRSARVRSEDSDHLLRGAETPSARNDRCCANNNAPRRCSHGSRRSDGAHACVRRTTSCCPPRSARRARPFPWNTSVAAPNHRPSTARNRVSERHRHGRQRREHNSWLTAPIAPFVVSTITLEPPPALPLLLVASSALWPFTFTVIPPGRFLAAAARRVAAPLVALSALGLPGSTFMNSTGNDCGALT